MDINFVNKTEEMVMALVHYFITEENYTPIVVRGVKDEVWLENIEGPYDIIRINSNYIHNEEQYKIDMFKAKKVSEQIKKKTLSLKVKTLNLLTNVGDNVKFQVEDKNIVSYKVDDLDNIVKDEALVKAFPHLKDKLLDKKGIDLLVNVTTDINAKTAKDNATYTEIFKDKKIVVTYAIIAICVILFIAMYAFGNGSEDPYTLAMFGANNKELVQAGQVYRLITSVFLHIGIVHLIVNMYSLYVIGRQLETFLGKVKYLLVFLISGITGSLLSCVLLPTGTVSAGASGAIFGLLGSLLYFGYHYRLYLGSVLKYQVIPIIVINLVLGFTLSGIDNFAHIGGLVGGYLATMALGVPGKSKRQDKINGWIVLILLVVFLSYLLFFY